MSNSKIFGHTKSVCPECLKVVDADKTVGEDGFIHLEKDCEEHGHFDTLIWEGDIISYLSWDTSAKEKDMPFNAVKADKGCPYDCGLCEEHESGGCCVLLELTNRCNLKCPVCFASAGENTPFDLSFEEISSQYNMLMQRGGPFNIQLSGGEPTLRDDLPQIISLGKEKGFTFFQLNTNGLRLANEEGYANKLSEAGVSCVFLQFDGFKEETYIKLRGKNLLEAKLKAIKNCKEARLPVILVPTVAYGVNDDEIGDIINFALENMPHIRGVHIQPMSMFGRCEVNVPRITIPRVLRCIEEQTKGLMKATDFGGGGAESAFCSFHASYLKKSDGSINALPKKHTECCCVKSSDAREFVEKQWSKNKEEVYEETPLSETSSFDEFLSKVHDNKFTVTGMLFQDAWNMDFDRLRRCYICEADSECGMVPFCAYNLTSNSGKSLYRNKDLNIQKQ